MALEIPTSDICSFCQDLRGERECAFVEQTDEAAAMVNQCPYERGAMLVIPRNHRETILDITDSEILAVYGLARRVALAAVLALGAQGVNIFQNNGIRAGQSESHFHVHVVPRYEHSDPNRNFRRTDFPLLSMQEQRAVAAEIRAAL